MFVLPPPPPPPAAVAASRRAVHVATPHARAGAASLDPTLASQPYLGQIGWTPGPGAAEPPLVAVLDTGIDPDAAGLAGRVDVAQARSFVPGSPALADREGHGTHVAGILATVAGGPPTRPGVRILPVKIADRTGEATTSSMVRGIRYAVARGAKVVNISFGGAGASPLEQEAIDEAVRAGVLVVASAGNTGGAGSIREYPGAYRHVLAVGAAGPDGRALATSTRGLQVAVAAPGLNIVSSAPAGASEYATRSGTSMAAAVVSGLAARLVTARPALDASQLREAIVRSARPGGTEARDLGVGAGVVRLPRALAGPVPSPDRSEPDDDPVLAGGEPPLLDSGRASATVRGRVRPVSDPRDDGIVRLAAGEEVVITLSGSGRDADLVVWRPGTPAFRAGPVFARRWVAAASVRPGVDETLRVRASVPGDYAVEVRAVGGPVEYRLSVRRA
ncbi:MAG: S8 family serine peptidase [Thermoleophilia bacterium]|nr:S8 family serine peptidase [Thermoleophilia bacterium]